MEPQSTNESINRPTTALQSIALLLIGLLVAGGLAEVATRIAVPEPSSFYYVWPPHFGATFKPEPAIMPGVTGVSKFSANSLGLRGEEIKPDQRYRILAVGGSTTECLFLDQNEQWPALLEKKLNQTWPGHNLWVGNAGRSGLETRDHIALARHLLPQLPKIDTVVFLVGVNDLGLRLQQDTAYNPNELNEPGGEATYLARTFSSYPNPDQSVAWYKRAGLYRLARRTMFALMPSSDRQDQQGTVYRKWREERQHAIAIRNKLPDMTSALAEYDRNINTLIDLTAAKQARPVFITQPVMWNKDLPKELDSLLWGGRVGVEHNDKGQEYYSVEALKEGMELYNRKLLEVCERRKVECVDMASALPKDATVFFDDEHFNETGAEQFAVVLARHLMQTPPISSAPRAQAGRIN